VCAEFDLKRSAPNGWLADEDGSHLCPHCSDRTSSHRAKAR